MIAAAKGNYEAAAEMLSQNTNINVDAKDKVAG